MDIINMLPLLRGWQYRIQDFSIEDNDAPAYVLAPGQHFPMLEEDGPGWVVAASMTTNYLYGQLCVTLDKQGGQTGVVFQTSLYNEILLHNDRPNNGFPWAFRYSKVPTALRKTITTAGTAEQLASSTPMPENIDVLVQALPGNGGNIYLAGARVDASAVATRKTLAPGQAVTIQVQDLDRIWLDADIAGNGVEALFEYPDTVPVSDAIFSIAFAPAHPLGFNQHIVLEACNPKRLPRGAGAGANTTRLNLSSFSFEVIRVVNEQHFRESIKEVLSTNPAEIAAALVLASPAGRPTIPVGARR